MKKILFLVTLIFSSVLCFADQVDTTFVNLDEIVVSSFYQNTSTVSSVINNEKIIKHNYGQEPSNLFAKMPSIISLNDNGTEFGYGYFRIRGLDQTRINVSIDGCPWNEAEDYGSYFANSPDLLSSMQNVKVEKGSASSYNGIAGVAGGIMLESINIFKPQESYAYLSAGSYNSYKGTVVYNMYPYNKWGLHIKATHQQTDGFRDYGFNSSQALTIKTGYKFNEKHTIDFLSMNGFHRNGQGWIGNTLEELSINPRANGCTEKETDNWFMTMNRLQYKMWADDNFLITSSVYFQFQDGSYRFDLDNYMKRMSEPFWENTYMLYDYGLRHNMVGANVVGKYYLNNLTLTVGGNGYNYERFHFLDNKSINVNNNEYYSNKGIKTDVSLFSNIQYKPIKGLIFSGNIQYRYAAFDYYDFVDNKMSFNRDDNNTEWDFCNFGFNIEYNIKNSLKTYGKFNYVNREPTRSDMFGGNENFTGELTTIVPEIAKDFELGAEYILGKYLYMNLNLYHMWFKNELVLNGEYGLNGLPCHDNADKSYRRGIEFDVNYQFWRCFHIDGNFSLSQNRVITSTFGEKNHILTPSSTANVDIYWDNYDFNIGFDTSYRNEMYVDMDNMYKIPYLWTLNFHGSYKYRYFDFGIRVNNITNKINYCTATVGVDNELLYFRNAGINFNLFIKYKF